jgi:transcriptional regulator GlxA family with amidase domain
VVPAGLVDDWDATFGAVTVPMELERQWRWLAFIAEHLAIATQRCQSGENPVAMPEAHLHADLAPAMLAIEEAPEAPHTLRSLAQLCHLSREHFLRRFKKAHGVTPLDYVRQRRIRKSLALLADGTQSIPQIASACGFVSRFHFTRLFTRYMAKSPGDYRRAHAR